jgi:hypothetical protein
MMAKPKKLKVRNWEKWQTYRRDRGQPPWIKIHRILMRDLDWIELSDAQRGQLICIWLLAADHDGEVPASGPLIQKLCHLESEPDLQTFIDLGFLKGDVNVTPSRRQIDDGTASARRQSDALEAEAETEVEEKVPRSTGKIEVPRASFDDDLDPPDREPQKGYDEQWLHIDGPELVLFCKDFGIPIEEMNRTLTSLGASEILEA